MSNSVIIKLSIETITLFFSWLASELIEKKNKISNKKVQQGILAERGFRDRVCPSVLWPGKTGSRFWKRASGVRPDRLMQNWTGVGDDE